MANHKRRKPKTSRAGCLLCKPHKHQRAKDKESSKRCSEKRADVNMKQQLSE